MSKSKRRALTFLIDQMELAEQMLSSEELGQLYIALRKYAIDNEQPDMWDKSPLWRATFGLMSRAQDKALSLYEETCERNRIAANRRWHKLSR